MKNPIKSVLSCTLSLALCVCFLPASAFAVEEPAEPVTAGESPATNGDFSDAAAPTVTPSPSVAGEEEGAGAPENVAESAVEETSETLENNVALEANAEKESVVATGTSKNGTDDSTACLWTLSKNGGSVRIPVLDNDGNQIKDEYDNPKFEDKPALTLTIEPKNGSSGTLENWDTAGKDGTPIAPPWIGKDEGAYVKQITHVKIEKGVTALTTRDMFLGCINLKDITGLENLNVSAVTNMRTTFGDCHALEKINISSWNTSKVKDMASMFAQCSALETITTPTASALVTGEATNTSHMFENCGALKAINTTNWDTSAITNMTNMFAGCSSLTSLNLSRWNTSKAEQMGYLFYGCTSLETLDFPDTWKTDKVTDMTSMFGYCTRLRTISGLDKWETDSVVKTYERAPAIDFETGAPTGDFSDNGMFTGCKSLESVANLSEWDVSSMEDMSFMFFGCESLHDISALSG